MELNDINQERAKFALPPIDEVIPRCDEMAEEQAKRDLLDELSRTPTHGMWEMDGEDDGWENVPFLFAWVMWFVMFGVLTCFGIGLLSYAFPVLNSKIFLGLLIWGVGTAIASLSATFISRYVHNRKTDRPTNHTGMEREEASRRFWRAMDAKNGLHRESGIDEVIRPTVNRGRLHHFTLTVGFRHEREEQPK